MTNQNLPQVQICDLILNKDTLQIAKYAAQLTVATAQKGIQLSKMMRENEENAIEVVCEVVRNLNDSINIGEKMTTEQIYETAVAILTEYWMLKIDELLNCFKMAKSGRFGQIYGLDQPTVMGFIHKYDTEIKSTHYDEIAPTHTNRAREENQGTKHIALSVEEFKKLEGNNNDKN